MLGRLGSWRGVAPVYPEQRRRRGQASRCISSASPTEGTHPRHFSDFLILSSHPNEINAFPDVRPAAEAAISRLTHVLLLPLFPLLPSESAALSGRPR